MSSDEGTKNINAIVIIEVLGRPPEHLVETLEDMTKKVGEEKGIRIINKKINEPTLMKDQKDFYTCFTEIELEAKEIFDLVILMFKYMPAHIEILYPENITLTNNGWGEALNELTRRLHGYEEIARVLQSERIILEKKLRELTEGKKPQKKKK